MNYNHLHKIVKNVKNEITCPKCQSNYQDEHIDVVDILGNRGVFVAFCTKCKTSILVTTSIKDQREALGLDIGGKLKDYTFDLNKEKNTELKKKQEITRPNIIKKEEITKGAETKKIKSTKISADDVLGIHEFMRNFAGDIRMHL